MKKIFLVLFLALSVGLINTASAITVTDNITGAEYGADGTTMLNVNGGSGWSSPWDGSAIGAGTWTKQTATIDVGRYVNDTITPYNTQVYRAFPEMTNSITITFKMSIATWAPADTISGGIAFIDSSLAPAGGRGPSVGFQDITGYGKILYLSTNGGGITNLLDGGTATDNQTYEVTLTISDVSAHTYSAQVTGYSQFNGQSFYQTDAVHLDGLGIVGGGNGSGTFGTVNYGAFSIQAVPEPSSIAFFGMGLFGLIGAGIRRFKKS